MHSARRLSFSFLKLPLVTTSNKEEFHEFLRGFATKFSENVYRTKDKTYKSLSEFRNNPDIVVLNGDKDSSVIIMDKLDYIRKTNDMIEEGIRDGKYVETTDNTHKNLANFQAFLYHNFKKHEKYDSMRPSSNQPGRFFATAKTHKFNSIDDITVYNLKLRPIIDQTNTYTNSASKIISKYLQPLAVNDYVINNTLEFPGHIKGMSMKEDEEDVSYDVESLFTSIPVDETIEYILDEIYVRKKLKPFCKKRLTFKRLLERLTKECVFSVNDRLIKQIDGCPMGGSLSVVFSGIFMVKMETDVVNPIAPIFYERYVDDVYTRRKKGTQDSLFLALNNYHPNIKLTIEHNPEHFLDTAILKGDEGITTTVYSKPNKVPVFWSSRIPKRYKRNCIRGELHRASKISSDFEIELKRIRQKFHDVGYPNRFVESVIRDFICDVDDDELIIPDWFFDDRVTKYIRLPFCESNEKLSKLFLQRLNTFTKDKFKFLIVWETRKIRSLFPLKDKVKHRSCVIYEGICSCGDKYIGETVRIAETRFHEHNNPEKNSEPSKHLRENPTHSFQWSIITSAPCVPRKRKFLEAFYYAKYKPVINDQLMSRKLLLFRHGIT